MKGHEPGAQDASEGIVVRRAEVRDAEVLARLAETTFVETFGHLYPPEDLLPFLEATYAVEAHERLLANEENRAWLLEVDGVAVGHALAGVCALPHPEVRAGDGELKRLYLRKPFHNRGLGGRLLQTALDWLEREGPRTLWIGVWSENFGAQRFYGRRGFEVVGSYAFPVGRVRDLELILRRQALARVET